MISLCFFFFGLVIGSFLNVVLLRTEKEESLTGRSHCPKCLTLIHWYDNIPLLSYIFLRGHCRKCQEPISLQYPLVELVTGLLFLLPAFLIFDYRYPFTWFTSGWWIFLLAILLIITIYDLRHMEIPLSFLLWGIGASILYYVILSIIFLRFESINWWEIPIVEAGIGGVITASLFYFLVWISHERWMGMGDVWLAWLSGMVVGPKLILLLLTSAFGIGAFVSIGLLAWRGKTLSSQVPFAPFLSLATIAVLILVEMQPIWLSLFFFPPVFSLGVF